MKKLIFIAFLTMLLSCQTGTQKNHTITIDVLNHDKSSIKWENLTLVPLQSDSGIMLGNDLLFQFENNEIFIADLGKHESMYRFSKDGRFVNLVGQQGKGPEEFEHIKDFTVHNDTIDIIWNIGTKCQIIGFRSNGEFLYRISVGIPAKSIKKVNGDYWLATGFWDDSVPFRLYKVNSKGDITGKYLKNNTKLTIALAERNLSGGEQPFYSEGFNDTIYALGNGGATPKYVCDFGALDIPDKFYNMNLMDGFEIINNNGFGVVKSFFDTNDFSIIVTHCQKKIEMVDVRNIIYRKRNGKSFCDFYEVDSDNFFCLKDIVGVSKDGSIIYKIPADEIVLHREEFSKLPLTNPEILDKTTAMDNPVLILGKTKEITL